LIISCLMLLVNCSEPAVDTFGNIAGTVTDSRSHSPLAGVTVKITPTGNSQVTGNNGTFQFDNLDVQEYTISFSKPGYQSHEEKVSVKPGLSSTIQINLVPMSSIAGTVMDSNTQSLLSGVTVKLIPGGNSVITGDDGSFHFDNIEAQEYTLSFSKSGYNIYEEKVTVRSGVLSTIQVNLIPKSSIVGTVMDSKSFFLLAGVSVRLNTIGSSQITDNDGAFRFDNLDAQDYTLSFSRTGYVTKEERITVRAGQTSTIQVTMSEASTSVPTLIIKNPSNLSKTSVRLHASISSTGGSQITQHGFCYGLNHNPTTIDQISSLGIASNVGDFSAEIDGLTFGTTYYVRAYAQNSSGISYSDEISFTTLSDDNGGGSNTNEIAVPGGLKLYYTFDDGDCSDATDYENDGIAVNNPTYITDTPNGSGKAIFINGDKEQYININFNAFKGLSSYSVCFWINDFTTGAVFTGINPAYDVGYQQNMHWPKMMMRNDGKISFDAYGELYDYNDNCPKFAYSYTPIQSSGWHHVSLTFDGSISYLYIDGILKDNLNLRWRNPSNITKINIGGNLNGSVSVSASMRLDNFRIYSRCLTKDDVKDIYEAEK